MHRHFPQLPRLLMTLCSLLLVLLSFEAIIAQPRMVELPCPPGATCHLRNPKVVSVFWSNSVSSWNASLTGSNVRTATVTTLNDLVRGLVESEYFNGLAEYGVSRPTLLAPLTTSGCASPPGTANLDDMKTLVKCVKAANSFPAETMV